MPNPNCVICGKLALCTCCPLCETFFCRLHYGADVHSCPTFENAPELYDAMLSRKEASTLEAISAHLKSKETLICTHASSLRNGVSCKLGLDVNSLSSRMGGQHCHADIIFNDGITWLLRILISHSSSGASEIRNRLIRSEFAALKFLESIRLPIPHAFDYGFEDDISNELGFGFIIEEKLPGEVLNWSTLEAEEKHQVLEQLVDIYTVLEKHPFSHIGSISLSNEIDGMAISCHTHWTGPFLSSQDEFRSIITEYLQQIVEGKLEAVTPVRAWLQYRWLLEQLTKIPLDNGPFYLKHGDDKGDHILLIKMRNGDLKISGIIDWEWTRAVTKAYAFSSPCMLWPVRDFCNGSNNLSTDENTLADIWKQRGRHDMADLIHNGRLLQRVVHSLEKPFSQDQCESAILFKGLLTVFGYNVSNDRWYEQWEEESLEMFAQEPGLQTLLLECGSLISR